jgi:pyridoxal phosphate enzyme (YggS family)
MDEPCYKERIARQLAGIRSDITRHADGRAITLLAASKAQPTEALTAAIALGISHFGENRVQEATTKWPELKRQFPHIRLHLIGPLQSNKAAEAVALFDCIESVDRPKIVDALATEMIRRARKLPVLVQVNTGEEAQKAGVLPQEADALIAYAQEKGLPVVGLMCVPPVGVHPAPHFAFLRQMAARHGLTTLSMGMSGDYVEALRMGATEIRLGTALFGEREPL